MNGPPGFHVSGFGVSFQPNHGHSGPCPDGGTYRQTTGTEGWSSQGLATGVKQLAPRTHALVICH